MRNELTDLQDRASGRARVAKVLYVTAGVLAAGTLLAWWFTDFGTDEAALTEIATSGTTLSFAF